MRPVILGDGLLGAELQKQTGWDIISRKKDGFDITNAESFENYFIEIFDGIALVNKYDTIINCIANTDTYSDDKQDHWNVNYKGVADLVDFCNHYNIKLIHISSDYVYINSDSQVSEEGIPIHGNNWYSYTKLLADGYIELKSNNYLICRGTHKPYPFPYKAGFIDQIGNFDYVNVIAGIITDLVESDEKGIYNVGTELKSMLDLAQQTKKDVELCLKFDKVPGNTTMNLTKLNDFYNNIQ